MTLAERKKKIVGEIEVMDEKDFNEFEDKTFYPTRNAEIRRKYRAMRADRMTGSEAKRKLSKAYSISEDMVNKLIYS